VVVAMKPDQPHDLHGSTGRSAPAARLRRRYCRTSDCDGAMLQS